MSKKFIGSFLTGVELQKAWDFCWQYFCEPHTHEELEYDSEGIPTGQKTGKVEISEPRQRWLTASDLEARIRCAAREQLEGWPYGSEGVNGWRGGVVIRTGTGLTVLDVCRDWLRRQVSAGRLVAHNFNKGHISGMRFRPPGVELTDGEQKTLATKEKRAKGEVPVHLRSGIGWQSIRPLCVGERKRATFRRPTRSKAAMTSDPAKVTCPRCLKLLAEANKSAADVGPEGDAYLDGILAKLED